MQIASFVVLSGATKGEIPEGSFGTTGILKILKNVPVRNVRKNLKIDDLGLFGPGKSFLGRFGARGEKNVQKYALAATFWAKTKFSIFEKFSKKQVFFAKSKGNMLQR